MGIIVNSAKHQFCNNTIQNFKNLPNNLKFNNSTTGYTNYHSGTTFID